MELNHLTIAMLCIHSSPIGAIGTRDTGGMSVYVRELALALGGFGNRIDIYTRTPVEPGPRVVDLGKNVRIIHLPVRGSSRLAKLELHPLLPEFLTALETYRGQNRIQYDLIYSHYWLSGCLGELAHQLWQVPHLVTFHTLGALKNSCGLGRQEPEIRIEAEQQLARQSTGVIMSSERERKNFIRYYGNFFEKTVVIPCGVNFDRFQLMDRQTARLELGLKLSDKVILYVGRFDPLKGIDCLLTAVSLLPTGQSVRLIVVGENSCVGSGFEAMLDELKLRQQVSFAGRIDHGCLPRYYSAADVLAVPSRYESFGLVGLEALACGTPVVTTPVGAMENIIRHGVTGVVVPDFSPRLFAKALKSMLAGTHKTLPEAARSSIAEYTWARTASHLMEHMHTVITHYRREHRAVPGSEAELLTKGSCL